MNLLFYTFYLQACTTVITDILKFFKLIIILLKMY